MGDALGSRAWELGRFDALLPSRAAVVVPGSSGVVAFAATPELTGARRVLMRTFSRALLIFTILLSWAGLGCDGVMPSDLEIERLPDVQPNLPNVPTIPPPPHPVQLEDSSYTVYGLRRRLRDTIDNDATVTGYIVEMYVPPECPEREQCEAPAAPHFFLADIAGEADAGKRLLVSGYAENQEQIDDAIASAARGRPPVADPETDTPPVPYDLAVGNQVKVTGRFTRASNAGFANSEGLLEYQTHETLQAVAAEDS